jgi:hypothetical protein
MRDITKWPRLLVEGDDVTREQANEILVRTDGWYFCTNDKLFVQAVYGLVGVSLGSHGIADWSSLKEFRKSICVLDLGDLDNDRIVSAWIGGPHGWCDWDGHIGCDTWNIGKWPSFDGITEEWELIAAAFPYLRLRAQIVADEGEGEIVGGWTVTDGAVTIGFRPEDEGQPKRICRPRELTPEQVRACVTHPSLGRERGVTLDRLRQAVAQVKGVAR